VDRRALTRTANFFVLRDEKINFNKKGDLIMIPRLKHNWLFTSFFAIAALAAMVFASTPAFAAPKTTVSGATLQASKTIDICDPGDDTNWIYSGVVSLWNEGAAATEGLSIIDCIQQKKVSGPNFDNIDCEELLDPVGSVVIPGFTPEENAITFAYSFTLPQLTRTIRNDADVTITNHSGHIGTPFGPEPKATYTGPVPPPSCNLGQGCTLTLGYWKTHTEAWPSGFDPNALFFSSGVTWLAALDPSQTNGSNGYYNLSHQYIAAVLNQANGATVPPGVQSYLDQAEAFFIISTTAAVACPMPNSCGLQKTWAAILETYNAGKYPDGPPHCDDKEVL
jgi:hypothetical protein